MHGLFLILLLAGRGPGAAKPVSAIKPTAPAAAAAPAPAVTLTPGTYALQRATADEAAPALEPVPLQTSPCPPLAASAAIDEPRYVSEKVQYARLPLGDEGPGVLIAMDESAGTGYGYDRLYWEANLDGNLVTAPPVEGRLRRAGSLQNVDFDCPALPAAYRATGSACGEQRAVRVRIHGFRLGDAPWRWSWDLGEYRVGEIAGCRGPMRVVLADSSMQAVYNRRCIYHGAQPTADGSGPQIWISPDATRPSSREPLRLSLGAAQLVNGRLYSFEPAADGSSLIVSDFTGTWGKAHIQAANARRQALALSELTLQGDAGRYEIGTNVVEQPLPEGQYYAIASVRQPDRDGDWVLTFRSRGALRLPPAKETSVTVGGTLRPLIAPESPLLSARRGQEVTVPLVFVTPAGHQLTGFDRPVGSASALVVVRTTRGRVIARGRSGFA